MTVPCQQHQFRGKVGTMPIITAIHKSLTEKQADNKLVECKDKCQVLHLACNSLLPQLRLVVNWFQGSFAENDLEFLVDRVEYDLMGHPWRLSNIGSGSLERLKISPSLELFKLDSTRPWETPGWHCFECSLDQMLCSSPLQFVLFCDSRF